MLHPSWPHKCTWCFLFTLGSILEGRSSWVDNFLILHVWAYLSSGRQREVVDFVTSFRKVQSVISCLITSSVILLGLVCLSVPKPWEIQRMFLSSLFYGTCCLYPSNPPVVCLLLLREIPLCCYKICCWWWRFSGLN